MTEAMSRREIEDVLSSIRRIVSHDVPAQGPEAPQPDLNEKLILTSALRVEDVAVQQDDAPVQALTESSDADAQALPMPATSVEESAVVPSLLGRIATASRTPPLVLEGAPAPEQGQPDPEDDLHASLEDRAMEATLARLEAVLANSVQPAKAKPASENASGDQIIDEGVLYQLVAHIVRQELQGELGEKITRNIRKLVRSEVARELELRKF
jgi:hypothetical protein